MRSRRLWIGFKVTCGNCNKAGVKRFLGVSPGICQLLLSFYSVDSVGNQRVTHREEGVCACVSMQVYLCVDVCVDVPLMVTASETAQTSPCSSPWWEGGCLAVLELF